MEPADKKLSIKCHLKESKQEKFETVLSFGPVALGSGHHALNNETGVLGPLDAGPETLGFFLRFWDFPSKQLSMINPP